MHLSTTATLVASLASQALAVAPLVNLDYSSYQGVPLANNITQWLGVRYAQPPVGNLRFSAPQDPCLNETVQQANAHGPICLGTGQHLPANVSAEDCLFLDVYAPSNTTPDSKLPVYFFIQGGGFNQNSNANLNGSGLIKAGDMDLIVVTFNYRVGPYGFLAAQEVIDGGGAANAGLLDQRKALQWVQKYISHFGGDPGHVVMGGDSAGAASVNLQLTAYNGTNQNLFHATVAESQSFAAVRTIPGSQYQYDNLVIRTGCASELDTFSCLRSLNTSFIQSINYNTPFPGAEGAPLYEYGPVIDGSFVSDYTYAAYAKGNFVKLPAIYGDDTNEGTVFTPNSTANISASNIFLKNQFPDLTPRELYTINQLYPIAEQFAGTGAFWRQAANAYGEIRYICPGIFISQTYTNMSLTQNWNYHWNVIDPIAEASGLGVTHTVELNAIFGPENVNGAAPASYNTSNANIVPVIQRYWTSFIRSYDPNTYRLPGSPMWQQFGFGDGHQRLLMQTNASGMETVPSEQLKRCQYLWSIGLKLKQ